MNLLAAVLCIVVFSNAPAAPKKDDLHRAVLDQDITLVKRLLSKGADINEVGSRSFRYGSALHLAIREGYVDIAKLLLDRGAEVDVLDPNDFTPLHNAAWNGNLDLVKLLLDAGADINASTYDGDTPLSLAQNNDQAQVAEFIQTRLQASSVVDAKVESVPVSDSGVIDISGTYTSEITHKDLSAWVSPKVYFGRRPKIEVEIEQNGNAITGIMSGDRTGSIKGVIKGNKITFDWAIKELNVFGGASGKGVWVMSDDHVILNGTWKTDYGDHEAGGNWNLTRIESQPIIDISGTYISEITYDNRPRYSYQWYFGRKPNMQVKIEQNANRIIAKITGDISGEIEGTIEGRRITFSYYAYAPSGGGNEGNGIWVISDDQDTINGTWEISGGSQFLAGKWNLTKIE